MSYNRINRINEEIKKELSQIIRELKDPRIPIMTSIIETNTTKDLKYCKIYVSIMGTKEEQNNAIEGLKSASGFIRRELGHRVKLRYVPELTFVLDESIEHGIHISEVLSNISKTKEEGENRADEDTRDS